MGVDLWMTVFTPGQLYVVLSQVTSAQEVTIFISENGDVKTNNIVYPKVLLWPP